MTGRSWGFSLLVLLVAGCGEPLPTELEPDFGLTCQVGCLDVDPYPNQPGIFLGHGVTPGFCFTGDYTDGDVDGLGDFCEDKLSAAFAPQLFYYQWDDVRREPRWAAKVEDDRVKIIYLLSYYRDAGAPGCGSSVINEYIRCEGHNGDSEHIILHVGYNPSTQHWLLMQADYSAHGGYNHYVPVGSSPCAVLEYPGRECGYPLAYVSVGKHANYRTDSGCDAGAFWFDECWSDTGMRVPTTATRNIGSRAHKFIDCVVTTNIYHPDYTAQREECYWTDRNFQGWWAQPAGTLVQSYSSILANNGF